MSTAKLTQTVNGATAATRALQKTQLALQAQSLRSTATVAAGVGVIAGAIAVDAVESAGQFDLGMRVIQNATGATTKQLGALAEMIHKVSDITAQSSTTIQSEMITAATSGLNSFQQLAKAFPSIAKAVDVLWIQGKASGRSFDVNDLTRRMVQASHMLQAYTPEALVGTAKHPGLLDWLVKLQQVQPEGLDRVVTQMRYFVPMGHALGMTTKQSMELLAVMGQTGFLMGKGGTSVANAMLGAITASTLTGFRQKSRIAALTELGILSPTGKNMVLTPQGGLDWNKFNRVMQTASTRLPEATFVRDLHNALNQQATYLMTAINTPAVRAQMQKIDAAFARLPGVQGMFEKLAASLPYQQARAWTTLQNTLQDIGFKLLPTVNAAMAKFADALGEIDQFLLRHGTAAKVIGYSLVGVSAAGFGVSLLALGRLFAVLSKLNALKFAGAGMTGGGILDVLGITSAINLMRRIATPMMGFFRSLTLASLLRWPLLSKVGSTLLGFVPVIGWAIKIAAALSAIIWALQHLGAILNWWRENKARIGGAIGFAFGELARLIIQGVQNLYNIASSAIASMIGAIKDNLPLVVGSLAGAPGAQSQLWKKIQEAMTHGAKAYNGPGFGEAFGRDFARGLAGQSYYQFGLNHPVGEGVHVHGDVIVHHKGDDKSLHKLIKAGVQRISTGNNQSPHYHTATLPNARP